MSAWASDNRPTWAVAAVALLAAVLACGRVSGQTNEAPPPGFEGATVVEKPNAQIPLDIEFNDENGQPVVLRSLFKKDRPVLFMLVYFQCPMLCNLTMNGVVKALQPLRLTPGRDFEVVTISFDTRETPALAKAKKANYLESLGKPEAAAGWHFLTSPRPEAARAIGDAIGFGYKLDPQGEQYLHQAAIYVCTPDGRVARTMLGVEFDATVLRDSLVNASAGKISSGFWGFAMSCGMLNYDPASGKYIWAAVALMRVVGLATLLLLGAVIGTMLYRERRHRAADAGQEAIAGEPKR
jgi:protein SCO1